MVKGKAEGGYMQRLCTEARSASDETCLRGKLCEQDSSSKDDRKTAQRNLREDIFNARKWHNSMSNTIWRSPNNGQDFS